MWFIAALAGLANTGTVLESVYRLFYDRHPETSVSLSSFGRWLQDQPIAGRFAQSLIAMPMSELLFVLFILCLILIAIAIAIFGAQQLTILTATRAASSEEPLPTRALINSLSHLHFIRLVALNGLGAVALLIVYGACGLLVETLATGNLTTDFFILLATYGLALPLAFAINLFTILSVIESVRRDEGILAAIQSALKALHNHWLMGLEVAALLFLVNLALSTIVLSVILGVTFFLSILSATAIAGDHLFLGAFVAMFSASIATAAFLCYGGFITLFNYTTWAQFLKELERKSILPVIGNMIKSILSYVPRSSVH